MTSDDVYDEKCWSLIRLFTGVEVTSIVREDNSRSNAENRVSKLFCIFLTSTIVELFLC